MQIRKFNGFAVIHEVTCAYWLAIQTTVKLFKRFRWIRTFFTMPKRLIKRLWGFLPLIDTEFPQEPSKLLARDDNGIGWFNY